MTADDIIDLAQRDFSDRSDAECLSDLQAIHDELCHDFKLKPSTSTINLTASTASYTLVAARVFDVRYRRSASEYKQLIPTHRDELDITDSQWRSRADSEPEYFFMEADKIYLVPAPDTTTSSGYPIVEADIASTETLSGATVLPAGLSSYRVYVEGLKARLALRVEDPRYGEYHRMYMEERKRLASQLHTKAQRFSPRWLPAGALGSFRRAR